ncbi:MAG: 16S rRNA (cytidine(1402)-2'-O)-methyltransferase [candidate division SR1 bacterium CG_4_9_14_3_um_filter_40_9]|nr:MAG: 16S rRNA (cytidine(1402)-2'-O)-methyltransferase [candidate division SR1 bacterium CG_4_9_14_3_um_filter_40_9]
MLYLIPTPIGNKDDITLRALKLFKELKYFICEDTRTTMKLLGMYEIDYKEKEFFSLTSFTNQGKLNHYLNILKTSDVGLVSEAGTPGLSDPGKSMIQICNENVLPYSILPGANALVPAVVGAGFDTSKFTFIGFLPTKKGRQTALKAMIDSSLRSEGQATFFYESVHRIGKLMQELKVLGFAGKISLTRELSKMFEQQVTASVDEILSMIKNGKIPLKGEFVIGVMSD